MLEYVVYSVIFLTLFTSMYWFTSLRVQRSDLYKEPEASYRPTVSIIVPAHNEEESLEETVRSILGSGYPMELLEVVIVDDGSTDSTPSIGRRLARKHPNVRFSRNRKNMGKAWSLNKGIGMARGDVIGCVDADSRITRGSIERAVAHLSSDENGAVISCIKLENTARLVEKLQWFEYVLASLMRRLMAGLGVLYVTPGVLSLYPKSLLERLGGFDVGNLTEDFEIALRIRKAGKRVAFEGSSVTYTRVPSTWKSLFLQRVRWYRGLIANLWKHRDIFFNKRMGFLGLFQVPLDFFSVAGMTAMMLVSFYGIFNTLKYAYLRYVVAGVPLSTLLEQEIKLTEIVLSLNVKILVPILLVVLMGLYMMTVAHEYVNEKPSLGYYVLFVLVYPWVLNLALLSALLMEAFGARRKWLG